MDIQFRCTSVSRFDEQKGGYENCNQLLQVSQDNAGLKVRCPRCNQMTVVPAREGRRNGSSVDPAEAYSGKETVARVEAGLSYGKFSRRTRCPKCGSLLDEQKKCTSCRYQTPTVKVSVMPISQMEVQTAGFQLWFRNIMSDGVGTQVFEVVLHSFLLIVVLALVVVAMLIGGSSSIFIIIAACVLAFFYTMVVVQTKRMATVPGVRLPFYMKPFWLLLLYLARAQSWQKYDSRLKDRLVIDMRGQPFGDRELLDLEKLNVCQVLDIEGTDITDNSLAAMHGLRHLRCLVIRRTHVTFDAVFRLQQSLPKCWIWY